MDWWRARFLTPIESGRLLAPPSELPQLELGGSVRHLRTLAEEMVLSFSAFLLPFTFSLSLWVPLMLVFAIYRCPTVTISLWLQGKAPTHGSPLRGLDPGHLSAI